MISYLEILKETNAAYHDLTIDQIKDDLNKASNKIEIINDIKNFIFKNNYKISYNVILNYLLFINKKKIDKELLYESSLYDKNGTNLDVLERKINLEDLSNLIFRKLEKLIYINRSSNKIDYTDISDDFNNFYNYENNKNLNVNLTNNGQILNNKVEEPIKLKEENQCSEISSEEIINEITKELTKDFNNGFITEEEIKYIAKKVMNKKYFKKSKVLFDCYSLEFVEKKILKFNYDNNILYKKDLNFLARFNILERTNSYKLLVKKIQNQRKLPIYNGSHSYRILDNRIYHYRVSVEDSVLEYNCDLVFNKLKLETNNETEKIFDIYDFNKIEKKLSDIINKEKNKVFYTFNLRKAFYTSSIMNIKRKILGDEKNPIKMFQFNILFNYFDIIQETKKGKDFLPITKYSGFLFKTYLEKIFSNLEYDNYLIYIDNFIVFGPKKDVDTTFLTMFNILQEERFSLSEFNIFDKYINSEINFLNIKFIFKNEDKFNSFDFNEKKIDIFLDGVIKIGNKIKGNEYIEAFSHDIKKKINYPGVNIDVVIKEEKNICEICRDRIKDNVLIPCGHLLCENCIVKIKRRKCPYCNENYIEKYKVFL